MKQGKVYSVALTCPCLVVADFPCPVVAVSPCPVVAVSPSLVVAVSPCPVVTVYVAGTVEDTKRTSDPDSDSSLQKELALTWSCHLTAAFDRQNLNPVSQRTEEIRQENCQRIGPHLVTKRVSDWELDAIWAC